MARPEPSVGGAGSDERVVGATFDDFAVFEDDDFVETGDGRETVSDDDGGAALHKVAEGVLDGGFGFGVEGGGGFVEDEDGGVFQNGASDGDALTLPTGELDAAFADHGVVAIGKVGDEFIGVGEACGFVDFFGSGAWFAVSDVFEDGTVKEGGFLRDVADGFAKTALGDVANVLTVYKDGAFFDVGETEEKFGEGGFAGAASADKPDAFARGDGEGEVLE